METFNNDIGSISAFLKDPTLRKSEIYYKKEDDYYLDYFCKLLSHRFSSRISEWMFLFHHYCPFSKLKVFLYRKLHNVNIGINCYMGPHCILDPHFPQIVSIGKNVLIGMNTRITTHEISRKKLSLGKVSIGDNTVIGAFSIIKPGVRIGTGAEIGMGSVVYRDVPDHATVIGNPARSIRSGKRK